MQQARAVTLALRAALDGEVQQMRFARAEHEHGISDQTVPVDNGPAAVPRIERVAEVAERPGILVEIALDRHDGFEVARHERTEPDFRLEDGTHRS